MQRLQDALTRDRVERGLAVLGAATALVLGARAVRTLWRFGLRPRRNLKRRYGGTTEAKAGHPVRTWAVVTGASGGIGRALCCQLAEAGFSVVLMARRRGGLEEVAEAVRQANSDVEALVVPIDASTATAAELDVLVRGKLGGLDVGILVNNVAVHNEVPANVDDMAAGDATRIIQVNCTFAVLLTRALLPLLRKHAAGGAGSAGARSAVVNVGSMTSSSPMPMLAVYAGSKAFLAHWSECLAAEMAPYGIDVHCLRPGLTVSAMSGISKPSLVVPAPETMARCMLARLGRETECVPYLPHFLMDACGPYTPQAVKWGIVRAMHQAKRAEMLRQRESEGPK